MCGRGGWDYRNLLIYCIVLFFFKQKTAYEIKECDWSSDVCSSDLVAAYEKYHDKGFDVFGVSLDNDRDKWLQAIQDDHLTWTQVSDLEGWGNSAAKLYGVNAIPGNFLLNKDGTILARNVRGQDLQDKLAELLK